MSGESPYLNKEVIIFGRNFINVLGQIRSFGEAGIKPILVWLDESVMTPKESKYIAEYYEVRSIQEGLDFIIAKFAEVGRKKVLLSDNDEIITSFDKNFDKLEGYFFFFRTRERGKMALAMQKEYQCRLASKYNMNPPRSEIVNVGEFPSTLHYPIISKVTDSTDYKHWKGYQVVCKNEGELREAYENTFSDFTGHDKILLQEFIEKVNELQVEGVSYNYGEDLYLPLQVLSHRQHKNGYGTYKYAEPYNSGEDLKRNIQNLLKEIGYNGVFEVEFLVGVDGQLYFLEINLRFTLFNYLLPQMGANLGLIWAQAERGDELNTDGIEIAKKSLSVIYDDRDFQLSVLNGDVKWYRQLKDFFVSDFYLIWNKKDLKPVYSYWFRRVKSIVKRHLLRSK